MSQQIINISDTQIVSGIEPMASAEGNGHLRILWATVPAFAQRPSITVNIYSTDDMDNSSATVVSWAVEYIPNGTADGLDLIGISLENAANDSPYYFEQANMVCSYMAIGERI